MFQLEETIQFLLLVKLMAYFDKQSYERFYLYYYIEKVSNNVISVCPLFKSFLALNIFLCCKIKFYFEINSF